MDDIIETMLLNLFFQGEIGTMMPYQDMFDGELAIIRPLAYVEENELTRLATILDLPVIASSCPAATSRNAASSKASWPTSKNITATSKRTSSEA